MPLDLSLPQPARTVESLERFIRRHVREAGAEGAVIALSGGIDSALTAALAARALGAGNVLGLLLPDGQVTPQADMQDAQGLADRLGIPTRRLPLAPLLEAASKVLPELPKEARAWGNLKARLRMTLNYALANSQNRLVLGTGNRTELLLGYFTKFGDGGADLLPLGALYKTQVRQLARYLGLPRAILEKTPSAGLWPGQTDEAELGAPYEVIDAILHGLVDLHWDAEVLSEALGVEAALVHRLTSLMRASQHKRQTPPIPVPTPDLPAPKPKLKPKPAGPA